MDCAVFPSRQLHGGLHRVSCPQYHGSALSDRDRLRPRMDPSRETDDAPHSLVRAFGGAPGLEGNCNVLLAEFDYYCIHPCKYDYSVFLRLCGIPCMQPSHGTGKSHPYVRPRVWIRDPTGWNWKNRAAWVFLMVCNVSLGHYGTNGCMDDSRGPR